MLLCMQFVIIVLLPHAILASAAHVNSIVRRSAKAGLQSHAEGWLADRHMLHNIQMRGLEEIKDADLEMEDRVHGRGYYQRATGTKRVPVQREESFRGKMPRKDIGDVFKVPTKDEKEVMMDSRRKPQRVSLEEIPISLQEVKIKATRQSSQSSVEMEQQRSPASPKRQASSGKQDPAKLSLASIFKDTTAGELQQAGPDTLPGKHSPGGSVRKAESPTVKSQIHTSDKDKMDTTS